jgi:hypothetical protein
MILHLLHIFFTDGLTFISDTPFPRCLLERSGNPDLSGMDAGVQL